MKFRVAMVGGALVCIAVIATAWVIRSTHHPPGASNASPQASSASDHATASASRLGSSGLEKVDGSPPKAVPSTRQFAINPAPALPNVEGIGKMPIGFDPTAWIRELSEEKRGQVENAFAEHAACVRERTSRLTRGERDRQIDGETMQQIWEDCDHGLKGTLRTVLSGEEYERFLSSLPPAPPADLEGPTVPIPPK
jgi:hypothetical protein